MAAFRSAIVAVMAIGLSSWLLPGRADGGPEAPPLEFQPYPLRHAQAVEVEAALAGLLPPGTEVVLDQKANRLLVRGPVEAHQTVQRAIQSLDRSPAQAASGSPPVAAQPILRTYASGAMDATEVAAGLQARFGAIPGVRIVPDKRTAQVLVLAPPEIQQQVSASFGGGEPAAPGERVSLPGSGLTVSLGGSPAPPHVEQLQLQHVPATRLESALVEMLGNRLALEPGSSPEMPTYRLRLSGNRSIGLAIDRRAQRVAVQGSGSSMQACLRLIQALDSPAQSPDQSLRMISFQAARGADIQRTVDAIRSANAGQGQPARDGAAPGKPGADRAAPMPGAQPGTPQPVPGAPLQAKPEETGSLIGPVQIEYLEGLDVMVLRGHRRDVQQVMEIIEQIERLSTQTQPSIEVYPLQHVNCEAMATLVRQLYDEVFAARQGFISITALVKPNALLIVGRPENANTVLDLVKRLDQPVSPESQFQVFSLQHASATTAQATVQEFFAQRGGLGPTVRVTADFRSNALIVQASPRDMAEVAAILSKLDTATSGAVNELRVFKLENTLAAEIAPVLQEAVNGQALAGARAPGQPAAARPGQPGAAEQKSNMLQFLTIDAQGQRRLKSGILTDVRITADTRANALLVSAPAESMPLLEALIRQMDQLPGLEAQVKVFTIVNGDATSLMDVLQSLFLRQTGFGAGAAAQAAMLMRTAASAGESSLVQLRFAADTRTNSIIASGTAGDLSVVEAILVRLDEGDIRNRKNTVYRLKNSPAQQVATALNEFLRSQRLMQQQIAPGLMSPFEQIEREVVVVPEIVRNALIISATPRYFDEIQKIVEELDARPPMVMIQVLIAEVALGSTDEFGIEVGLQDSILFDRSVLGDIQFASEQLSTAAGILTNQRIVSATNTPGFAFGNAATPLGNSGSTQSLEGAHKVGGQGLTSLGVGRTNSQLGFGGLVLSASSENVTALIRALKQCQRLEVLSRPQVMTLDNQPAFIQVGQRVPRIASSQMLASGQVNTVTMDNVGLILAVTPRISPDGLVVMEIDAENSKVGPESEGIPISINLTGDVIRAPRIDTTVAQTTISATSGQTVVLGGLITKSKNGIHRRVPLLSDIPLLGQLFRYDSEVDQKNELLIIMTPHIVKSERDAERIKQVEAARMDWCLSDVVKLHGDAGLRGRRDDWANGEVPVVYPDLDPTGGSTPGPVPGVEAPEVIPVPGAMPPQAAPAGQPAGAARAQSAPAVGPAMRPDEPNTLNAPAQRAMPQTVPQQLPGGPSRGP